MHSAIPGAETDLRANTTGSGRPVSEQQNDTNHANSKTTHPADEGRFHNMDQNYSKPGRAVRVALLAVPETGESTIIRRVAMVHAIWRVHITIPGKHSNRFTTTEACSGANMLSGYCFEFVLPTKYIQQPGCRCNNKKDRMHRGESVKR